jgi:hypothetical protein
VTVNHPFIGGNQVGGSIMTSDAGGLWPHDPEALDDNRSVDDLEIPDDDTDDVDDGVVDEWGDDADNRTVDLDDDELDDDLDLDR